MKNYQKAQMIAKNLPTGSYAAGCPTGYASGSGWRKEGETTTYYGADGCRNCEVAQ